MITTHTAKDGTKSYYVRVGNGPSKAFSERDFRTRSEAKIAAGRYELDLKSGKTLAKLPTIEQYAQRLLKHWASEVMPTGRKRKASSLAVLEQSLKPLRSDYGSSILGSIARDAARDSALTWPANAIKAAAQLMNRALDEFPSDVTSNPFRGLAPGTRGRSDDAPPTPEEFERLVESCSVLDKKTKGEPYAPMLRAFLRFAAHSGMRPGELYVLEWDDIDFDAKRIHVQRRLWSGTTDLPKSNATRKIVLTKEARQAIEGLPRTSRYVFVSKRGSRLSQSTLSGYWGKVTAEARLDFDLYHATKHMCCHRWFVVEGKSPNAIAQQMGWSLDAVQKLLRIYGHGAIGWEAEFEQKVTSIEEARQRKASA